RHARRRLVEEQQPRALREGQGELELAALAVRERARRCAPPAGEPHALEELVGARALARSGRGERSVRAGRGADGERDVLASGERLEQLVALIHAREPPSRELV